MMSTSELESRDILDTNNGSLLKAIRLCTQRYVILCEGKSNFKWYTFQVLMHGQRGVAVYHYSNKKFTVIPHGTLVLFFDHGKCHTAF